MKPKIAVSIGDLNGVGIEIALKAHRTISEMTNPVYCINETMLGKALHLLNLKLPEDFQIEPAGGDFEIIPGKVSAESGRYSFDSFKKAISLVESKKAHAVVTMPIHKEAWASAGINYKGHTDMLRDYFGKDAIMMLGCDKLYVALFSEHIPLRNVADYLDREKLFLFLMDLYRAIGEKKVAVLGLNPHAGDNGVLGDEEKMITEAIVKANKTIGRDIFFGPVVPDIAFSPSFRANFSYYVAMYHDQGLAPLKALYFDESVNVSLNLPIIRTSVDHGTAFDISYTDKAKTTSYINAVKTAIELINAK